MMRRLGSWTTRLTHIETKVFTASRAISSLNEGHEQQQIYSAPGAMRTRYRTTSVPVGINTGSAVIGVQRRGHSSMSHHPSFSRVAGHRNPREIEDKENDVYTSDEVKNTESNELTEEDDFSSMLTDEEKKDPFCNIRNHTFFRQLLERVQKEMPIARSAYEVYSKDTINMYVRPILQLVDKAFTIKQLHQLLERVNPSVLQNTLRTETSQRTYHVFLSPKLGTILDWSVEDFLRRRYESIHLSWEPLEVVGKRLGWSEETMTNGDVLVYFSKFEHLVDLARLEVVGGKPKALPIRNPLELARRGGIAPTQLLIRRKPSADTEPSLTESIRLMGSPSLSAPTRTKKGRRSTSRDSVSGVFEAVEAAAEDGVHGVGESARRLSKAADSVPPTRQASHPAGRVIKEFSIGKIEASTASAENVRIPAKQEDQKEEDTVPQTFNQYEYDNLCGVYHRRKVEISLLRRRISSMGSSDQVAVLQDRLSAARKELSSVGEKLKLMRILKNQRDSGSRYNAGGATVNSSTTLPPHLRYQNQANETTRTTTITHGSSISKNDNAAVDASTIIQNDTIYDVDEDVQKEQATKTASVSEEVEEGCVDGSEGEDTEPLAGRHVVVSPQSVLRSSYPPSLFESEQEGLDKESAAAELAASAVREFEDDEQELLMDRNGYRSAIRRHGNGSPRAPVVKVLDEEAEMEEDVDTMQELARAEEELELEASTQVPSSLEADVGDTEEELMESAGQLRSCDQDVGEARERPTTTHPGAVSAEEEDLADDEESMRVLQQEERQLRRKMEATRRKMEKTTEEWRALEEKMREALDLHNTRLAEFEKELEAIRHREKELRLAEERAARAAEAEEEEAAAAAESSALKAAEERAKAAEEKLHAQRVAAMEAQEKAKVAQERQAAAELAAKEMEKELLAKRAEIEFHSQAGVTDTQESNEGKRDTMASAAAALSKSPQEVTTASSKKVGRGSNETVDVSAIPSTTESPEDMTAPLPTRRADSAYTVSDFMCTPEQYDGLHLAAQRLRREIATLEKEMEEGDAEDDETLMSVLAASRADLEELEECISSVQHNADWAAASDAARADNEAERLKHFSPAARQLQEAIDTHLFNLTLLEKRLHVATQRGVINKLEQGIVHARREVSRLRREQDRLRRNGGGGDGYGVPESISMAEALAVEGDNHGAGASAAEAASQDEMEEDHQSSNYQVDERSTSAVEQEDDGVETEGELEAGTEDEDETSVEGDHEELEAATSELLPSSMAPEDTSALNNYQSELEEITGGLFSTDGYTTHTDSLADEEDEEMKYEEAAQLKLHLDNMVRDIQNLQGTISSREGDAAVDEETAAVLADLKEKLHQLLQIRDDVQQRLEAGCESQMNATPNPATAISDARLEHNVPSVVSRSLRREEVRPPTSSLPNITKPKVSQTRRVGGTPNKKRASMRS